MANLNNWLIQSTRSDGSVVTKSAADWGILGLRLADELGDRSGKLTFSMPAAGVASAPVFPFLSQLALYRNVGGAQVCWFRGVVTKIPRKGSTRAQMLTYDVSDPWWWLEVTTFQQLWVTQGGAGTSLRSALIMGQTLQNAVMDTTTQIREILNYALYAAMGLPYPTVVDPVTGLVTAPLAPEGVTAPFQIGAMPPDVYVPAYSARDQKCAEAMTTLFRYLPDVGKYFDYTTTPPTLNIVDRTTMPAKTIKAVTSNLLRDGYAVSGFDPEALYEEQVPAVFIKYAIESQNDGQVVDDLVVDVAPAGALENTPRAFCQTVDLQGARATYQKQDVTVADMPYDETSPIATQWVKKYPLFSFIFGTATVPTTYDTAGISLAKIVTEIDPSDPNATNPQAGLGVTTDGVITADMHAVPEELTAGHISTWMIEDEGVLACRVIKTVTLTYSGADASTLALFNTDPNKSNTLVLKIVTVATNAQTQTYREMTSFTQGTQPPLGYAAYLYARLGWLHQQGEVEITEQECSGVLPLGYLFNTSDGAEEWQDMAAMIIAVDYDFDAGKTTVRFGPTRYLGLGELLEIQKANAERVPPVSLTQRSTGQLGNDNAVIGHAYAAGASLITTPGGAAAEADPWALTIKSAVAPATGSVAVVNKNSILAKSQAEGDTITVDGLAAGTPVPIDSTPGSTDIVYLEVPIANLAPSGDGVIKTKSGGGTFDPTLAAWDPSGNAYLACDTSNNQTFFRILLAKVSTGPAVGGVTPAPTWTACCSANLMGFENVVNGIAAWQAQPANSVAASS